jgi:N-acetylglutamate synthase-like GNAT family acetyltransferase
MKIVYLPKDDELIKTLATWIYNEWLRSNPDASIDRMISILSARAGSVKVPLTVVALNDEGHPIGVANLTESDMKTRTDLTPWLGGVYVPPESRGKGVGSALCKRIENEAKRLDFSKAYLFTKNQQRLYSKLGWKTISVEQYKNMEVTVMELQLVKSSVNHHN